MPKNTTHRVRKKAESDQPISLAPLDFETALRAALATGPMPPKAKKPKAKKRKGAK
jgi:hypothetical protein